MSDAVDDFLKRNEWLKENDTGAALKREIAAYLEVTGMEPKTFGWKAAGEPGLVERLGNGGGITVAKLDVCRWYMLHHLTKTQRKMFKQLLTQGE